MSQYLILNGDSRMLPIDLSRVNAVVTDPPYGMGWNTDTRRFSGGNQAINKKVFMTPDVLGDDRSFDPMPWLSVSKLIVWGCNHFSAKLPVGTTLVWVKKADRHFGTFLSDAEIAWMKGGFGVYCFRRNFAPPSRISEGGQKRNVAHPTQKPIALMRWCIRKLNLQPDSLILDPYMGSGTTIIAALQEGHRAIGIEIDPRYCEIARRRLERPHAEPLRPERSEHHPLFDRGE